MTLIKFIRSKKPHIQSQQAHVHPYWHEAKKLQLVAAVCRYLYNVLFSQRSHTIASSLVRKETACFWNIFDVCDKKNLCIDRNMYTFLMTLSECKFLIKIVVSVTFIKINALVDEIEFPFIYFQTQAANEPNFQLFSSPRIYAA